MSRVAQWSSGRERWSSESAFVLSCVAQVVGLGNIWRFPFKCGQYGGASFVIVYLLMALVLGLPVLFMQLALGQYSGASTPLLFYRLCPIASGVGVAMNLSSYLIYIFYNVILGWIMCYFANCFRAQLPWRGCNNTWNTERCFDVSKAYACLDNGQWYFKDSCHNITDTVNTEHGNFSREDLLGVQQLSFEDASVAAELGATIDTRNLTRYAAQLSATITYTTLRQSPATEYKNYFFGTPPARLNNTAGGPLFYENQGITDVLDDGLNVPVVIGSAAAALVAFLLSAGGVRVMGKINIIVQPAALVLLVIWFVYGLTLDGSGQGVNFYMLPNSTKLENVDAWLEAGSMTFFSLSLGFGTLSSLASHNTFHSNVIRMSLLVVLIDVGISLLSGFLVFSAVGHLAHKQGDQVNLATVGSAVVLETIPQALGGLPDGEAHMWTALFYLIVLIIGCTSEAVLMESLMSAASDVLPAMRRHWGYRVLCSGALCTATFLLGLPLTANGSGERLVLLLDDVLNGWPSIVTCFYLVIHIVWIYGLARFQKDVEQMVYGAAVRIDPCIRALHRACLTFCYVSWLAITPSVMMILLIMKAADSDWAHQHGLFESLEPWLAEQDVPLPALWHALAALTIAAALCPIPICAVVQCALYARNTPQKSALVTPTEDWQPNLPVAAKSSSPSAVHSERALLAQQPEVALSPPKDNAIDNDIDNGKDASTQDEQSRSKSKSAAVGQTSASLKSGNEKEKRH